MKIRPGLDVFHRCHRQRAFIKLVKIAHSTGNVNSIGAKTTLIELLRLLLPFRSFYLVKYLRFSRNMEKIRLILIFSFENKIKSLISPKYHSLICKTTSPDCSHSPRNTGLHRKLSQIPILHYMFLVPEMFIFQLHSESLTR